MKRFVADQSWPIPYLYDESQEVAHGARRGRDAARLRLRLGPPARLPGRAGLRPHRREPGRRVAARRDRRRARRRGAGPAGDAAARLQRQVARLTGVGPRTAAGVRRPPPPPAPRPRARTRSRRPSPPRPTRSSSRPRPVFVGVGQVADQRDRRARARRRRSARSRPGASRRGPAPTAMTPIRSASGTSANECCSPPVVSQSSARSGSARSLQEAVSTSIEYSVVTSARTIRRAAATPSDEDHRADRSATPETSAESGNSSARVSDRFRVVPEAFHGRMETPTT